MTRFSVACLCLFAVLAVVPARAEPAAVVAVSRSTYIPGDDDLVPAVVVAGQDLEFRNHDSLSFGSTHSITSDAIGLFNSGVIQAGQATTVDISSVPAGTYGFHCSVHQDVMHGTLIIV